MDHLSGGGAPSGGGWYCKSSHFRVGFRLRSGRLSFIIRLGLSYVKHIFDVFVISLYTLEFIIDLLLHHL